MSNKPNRGPAAAPAVTQAPQTQQDGVLDETTQAPEPTEAPEVTEAPTPTEAPAPAPAPATQAIPTPPEPTPAPLPTLTAEQLTTAQAMSFEERIDQVLPQASPEAHNLVSFLRTYRELMQVRTVVTNAIMVQQQLGLWKTIRNTIQNAPDFNLAFGLLIGFFREYGQAEFREQSVFRAMEMLPLDADQLAAFQRMLNLLILASRAPTHADTLRQVDLNKTLNEGIYGDEGRNRVIQYFRG